MKMTNPLDKANVIRAPQTVYSPDLSPCDFGLYGLLKHWMADRQLQSPKENWDALPGLWDDISFEELQNVFLAWMGRLQ
jgi:hypothetical protein